MSSHQVEDNSVPPLDGWILLTEAAERLQVTRQHALRMVNQAKFASARQVGEAKNNTRVYLVQSAEVDAMVAAKEAKKAGRQEKVSEKVAPDTSAV